VEQKEQAVAAISKTPGPEGCEFSVDCAAACPDYSDRDIVIIDEAHHSPATGTWLPALKTCRGIVWAFSATPWHDDEERNKVVRELFQDFFVIDRSRVEASGHLAPGKVWMHDLDIPGQFDAEIESRVSSEVIRRCRRFPMVPRFEHLRRAQWQITQEIVQTNENRNSAAVRLSLSELAAGQSVLLLVSSIDHGSLLASRIPGSALCHSKVGAKNRRNIIEGFRSGAIPAMVATSLADEGFDAPRASRLVLVSGGRSSGKVEQRVGRILRPFAGKEAGIVHDFLDRGACYAAAQARARWKTYEKLGYDPEIVSYR
jgi:superfamily II DNA or RNA helicase